MWSHGIRKRHEIATWMHRRENFSLEHFDLPYVTFKNESQTPVKKQIEALQLKCRCQSMCWCQLMPFLRKMENSYPHTDMAIHACLSALPTLPLCPAHQFTQASMPCPPSHLAFWLSFSSTMTVLCWTSVFDRLRDWFLDFCIFAATWKRFQLCCLRNWTSFENMIGE